MKIINLNKETNEIQRVIALRNSRSKRHRYKEFIIEGRIAIDEAFNQGWKIKSLYYNKETKLSTWASDHLSKKCITTAYAVPATLMQKISDKCKTPELIAIGETQLRGFSSYSFEKREVIIVLDQPNSPGNLGMIIRSAVVFGANAIIISGHGVDEYDPKCIRSSMGTFFSLPIFRVSGVNSFFEKVNSIKSERDINIIISGDRGNNTIDQADLTADIVFLVLGNESNGISQGYKEIANMFIQIPTIKKFTSLNIGAAATIFLYEIFLKRKNCGMLID